MTESCTYYLNSRFIVDYLLLFKTKKHYISIDYMARLKTSRKNGTKQAYIR